MQQRRSPRCWCSNVARTICAFAPSVPRTLCALACFGKRTRRALFGKASVPASPSRASLGAEPSQPAAGCVDVRVRVRGRRSAKRRTARSAPSQQPLRCAHTRDVPRPPGRTSSIAAFQCAASTALCLAPLASTALCLAPLAHPPLFRTPLRSPLASLPAQPPIRRSHTRHAAVAPLPGTRVRIFAECAQHIPVCAVPRVVWHGRHLSATRLLLFIAPPSLLPVPPRTCLSLRRWRHRRVSTSGSDSAKCRQPTPSRASSTRPRRN